MAPERTPQPVQTIFEMQTEQLAANEARISYQEASSKLSGSETEATIKARSKLNETIRKLKPS